MLGGTVIGEESNMPGTANEQVIRPGLVKQHFIYLSEIERVIGFMDQLIIVKKNQDIDKFIFRNEDKLKEFLTMIIKNY